MRLHILLLVSTLFVGVGSDGVGQELTTGSEVAPPPGMRLLSELLADVEKPVGPEIDSPYAEVPEELDQAVRFLAMDNFTSAAAELLPIYEKYSEGPDRARVAMWLGLTYGIQAMNYPSTGWETGTSATTYLKEAMRIDPKVIEAPDAARVMAEMVAHGWANEDPATALQRAEHRAEETRRPIEFYFAGVISRRLSARAWGYSDTSEQDQRTLGLFAKSIARDPSRYESWSAYLPALMPAGMHDLATTEAEVMYTHFKNLRTPLLADQGPAVLKISTSSYRTMEGDMALLDEVAEQWPDAPMPPFEVAMRAIETTVPMALELFPKLIEKLENGELKPLPREAGYHVSALYKYAFLLQTVDRLDDSIEVYKQVRELSPGYAEVNLNLAILHALKSEQETTGPVKLALLQEALKFTEEQEKLDYRGQAALKADEMRRRLRSVIYRLRTSLEAGAGE